jgi:hypothetical protein
MIRFKNQRPTFTASALFVTLGTYESFQIIQITEALQFRINKEKVEPLDEKNS